MDSIAIKLAYKPLKFNSLSPKPNFGSISPLSIFKFNHFSKLKNFRVSVSYKSPSNSTSNLSINPFSAVIPIFHKWVSHFKPDPDTVKPAVVEESFSSYNSGDYLQNGGFGVAILSLTTNAKVKLSPFVATLATNPTFVSGFVAWAIAQSTKIVLNFFVERKWDFRIMFASGGMPSSHSALCTALTTSVALCHGVADSLFPVCLGFSLIVMYDAIGVRRHAGMQAEVLNMIVADLFQGHPISQRKLKELLGHTPSQVLAGALLGIVVACICCQGCLVAT